MSAVSLNTIDILANNYTDRLVAEGHTPTKAHQLARARAAREIASAQNTQPEGAVQLADRVRNNDGSATIVQLADRLVKETPGLDREQAFIRAEKLIRAR